MPDTRLALSSRASGWQHIRHHPFLDLSLMQCCWLPQGFNASLELLPMWSGVDSDVELFASGRVLDDDGEWSGGQTLGDDAGALRKEMV